MPSGDVAGMLQVAHAQAASGKGALLGLAANDIEPAHVGQVDGCMAVARGNRRLFVSHLAGRQAIWDYPLPVRAGGPTWQAGRQYGITPCPWGRGCPLGRQAGQMGNPPARGGHDPIVSKHFSAAVGTEL